LAILTALTLRAVFRLAYRQAEGLIGSILSLLLAPMRIRSFLPMCWGGAEIGEVGAVVAAGLWRLKKRTGPMAPSSVGIGDIADQNGSSSSGMATASAGVNWHRCRDACWMWVP
jgi:hypothetical protein